MSPEQARGIPTDARADVRAFGCCLYEALTGSRPFQGDDAAQILASVLKDTPDWSALPEEVPDAVGVLLRRCLEKSRRARLQSIGDARVELEESLSTPEHLPPIRSSNPPPDQPRHSERGRILAAAALLAIVGAYARGGDEGDAVARHFQLALPAGVELAPSRKQAVTISPDGSQIAFLGRTGDEVTISPTTHRRRRCARPRELRRFSSRPTAGSSASGGKRS